MQWALGSKVKALGRAVGLDIQRDRGELGRDSNRDLLRLCPEPHIVFDVGANAGQSIVRFKTLFPNASIHSFEPDAKIAVKARERAGSYADVTVNTVAVGAEAGELTLNVFSHSDMSSFLGPGAANWSTVQEAIKVPVVTVDEYCARNHVASIGLLKSDTQGFDLEVLRGARTMLGEKRIAYVLAEMNFDAIYEGQAKPEDMLGFMREAGYRVVSFYDPHYINQRLGWLEVLWTSGEGW